MKRYQLHFFALTLPMLAVGCPADDATNTDEVGETATDTTDSSTTDSSTTDSSTTDTTTDTTATDTTTTDTTTDTTATDTTATDTTATDTTATDTGTDTSGAVCGDAIIDAGEDCEGADLAGADCASLGFTGGELLCGADCLFDVSGCTDAACGNGVVEGNEECDGADLGGLSCVDYGFSSGEITCADDCTVLTDACTNCGNDLIDDPEICDGADLGGETCAGLGYLGGTLSCSDTCDALVESLCANDWWGEDFEGGAVLPPEWVLTGNANWFGSGTMPHAGAFTGESGNIADSQSSVMTVDLNYVAAGTARFWYRTSSESGWDFLRFYIDGVQQAGAWSGNIGWTQSPVYNIAAGPHTLRWSYIKDGSLDGGSDTVWVDDIVTTNALLP